MKPRIRVNILYPRSKTRSLGQILVNTGDENFGWILIKRMLIMSEMSLNIGHIE